MNIIIRIPFLLIYIFILIISSPIYSRGRSSRGSNNHWPTQSSFSQHQITPKSSTAGISIRRDNINRRRSRSIWIRITINRIRGGRLSCQLSLPLFPLPLTYLPWLLMQSTSLLPGYPFPLKQSGTYGGCLKHYYISTSTWFDSMITTKPHLFHAGKSSSESSKGGGGVQERWRRWSGSENFRRNTILSVCVTTLHVPKDTFRGFELKKWTNARRNVWNVKFVNLPHFPRTEIAILVSWD